MNPNKWPERLWLSTCILSVFAILNFGFQNCAPSIPAYDDEKTSASACDPDYDVCDSDSSHPDASGRSMVCYLSTSAASIAAGQKYYFYLQSSPSLPNSLAGYRFRWFGSSPEGTLNGQEFPNEMITTSPPTWEFVNPGVLGGAAQTNTRYLQVIDPQGNIACDTRGSRGQVATYALLPPTCSLDFSPRLSYIPTNTSVTLQVRMGSNQYSLPGDAVGIHYGTNLGAAGASFQDEISSRTATGVDWTFKMTSAVGFASNERWIELRTSAGQSICTTNHIMIIFQ